MCVTGSIAEAVRAAIALAGFTMKVEVEVANAEQAFEAIGQIHARLIVCVLISLCTEAGAHIVMLDNNDPVSFAANAAQIKACDRLQL